MALTDNEEFLTPVKQRAIDAILSTRSIAEAATVADCSLRTLHRWLKEPAFKTALTNAEGELLAAATRRLLHHHDTATTVVLSIMLDKSISAGVRLRAAQIVIETMLKLRELRNVEERLSALEAALAK